MEMLLPHPRQSKMGLDSLKTILGYTISSNRQDGMWRSIDGRIQRCKDS